MCVAVSIAVFGLLLVAPAFGYPTLSDLADLDNVRVHSAGNEALVKIHPQEIVDTQEKNHNSKADIGKDLEAPQVPADQDEQTIADPDPKGYESGGENVPASLTGEAKDEHEEEDSSESEEDSSKSEEDSLSPHASSPEHDEESNGARKRRGWYDSDEDDSDEDDEHWDDHDHHGHDHDHHGHDHHDYDHDHDHDHHDHDHDHYYHGHGDHHHEGHDQKDHEHDDHHHDDYHHEEHDRKDHKHDDHYHDDQHHEDHHYDDHHHEEHDRKDHKNDDHYHDDHHHEEHDQKDHKKDDHHHDDQHHEEHDQKDHKHDDQHHEDHHYENSQRENHGRENSQDENQGRENSQVGDPGTGDREQEDGSVSSAVSSQVSEVATGPPRLINPLELQERSSVREKRTALNAERLYENSVDHEKPAGIEWILEERVPNWNPASKTDEGLEQLFGHQQQFENEFKQPCPSNFPIRDRYGRCRALLF